MKTQKNGRHLLSKLNVAQKEFASHFLNFQNSADLKQFKFLLSLF
jgi:hypothetical protein